MATWHSQLPREGYVGLGSSHTVHWRQDSTTGDVQFALPVGSKGQDHLVLKLPAWAFESTSLNNMQRQRLLAYLQEAFAKRLAQFALEE